MIRSPTPLLLCAAAVLVSACGSNPPTLLAIGDQTVALGETLAFDVRASDPDTDALTFTAEGLPIAATFEQFAPTQAAFRWSPSAADVGDHSVDLRVSDGSNEDSERILIRVTPGASAGPEFLTPTTWFVDATQKSIERTIEVKDDTATELDWSLSGAPEGATLTPLLKRAVFFWEPTAAQRTIAQHDFSVKVTNPVTSLSTNQVFTILIRSTAGCTGTPPTVESTTPDTVEDANDFPVTATITDAESKIVQATMSYAFGADPSPAAFVTVQMTEDAGTWSALVHRGEDLVPGEFETVTYELCATDDDDATDDACDRTFCTPRATFVAKLPPGGGLCETCTADTDCGGPDDRCLTDGAGGQGCGLDCTTSQSCPNGFVCIEVETAIFQCKPDTANNICGASPYRAALPGELVINEILADPAAAADVNGDGVASVTGDEFVEFVSLATEPVGLDRFTLSDAQRVRYTFPVGTFIRPGEPAVIFGGGDVSSFGVLGAADVYSASSNPDSGSLGLNNGGDQVQIRDGNFQLITAMSYGTEGGQDEALTLEPQVEGFTYVLHSKATGATEPWSPGTLACGLLFPLEATNTCGGVACAGTSADSDAEPNNSQSEASCVSGLPQVIKGSIEYHGGADKPGPDPWDYYVFTATAGDVLRVDTNVPGTPENLDTYVKVLDATGQLLVDADDVLEPLSLRAVIDGWTVPFTGSYWVAVGTFQGTADQTGNYELDLEIVP